MNKDTKKLPKKEPLEVVERKTEIIRDPKGCAVGLRGCFWTILWCIILSIAVKECKRADVRLAEEKIKLEQMQNGTLKDTTPAIKPDTLKILNFQKEYIPLLKMNQKTR